MRGRFDPYHPINHMIRACFKLRWLFRILIQKLVSLVNILTTISFFFPRHVLLALTPDLMELLMLSSTSLRSRPPRSKCYFKRTWSQAGKYISICHRRKLWENRRVTEGKVRFKFTSALAWQQHLSITVLQSFKPTEFVNKHQSFCCFTKHAIVTLTHMILLTKNLPFTDLRR